MLDYAPNDLAGGGATLEDVAHACACIELPDTDRLLRMIAAARQAPSRRPGHRFEAERLSGFCAAG
jgi:hypothetical protein